MKTCERCPEVAIAGERYCRQCRRVLLAEMRRAGYFDPKPPRHDEQSPTQDPSGHFGVAPGFIPPQR
jgi:hypothetical protein